VTIGRTHTGLLLAVDLAVNACSTEDQEGMAWCINGDIVRYFRYFCNKLESTVPATLAAANKSIDLRNHGGQVANWQFRMFQVTRSGAWLPDGRLYKSLRIGLVSLHYVFVAGPNKHEYLCPS